MWKWVIVAAASIVLAAGLVLGIGLLLPRDHHAAAEAVVPAPPGDVAALIREVEAHPRWRRDVQAIEILARTPQGFRYVERTSDGAITYDFSEEVPGRRFRSTIADPSLPLGGYWIFSLESAGGGTRIRIEEHGSVSNPLYRFFSTLVFGHDRNLKAYLADITRRVAAPS